MGYYDEEDKKWKLFGSSPVSDTYWKMTSAEDNIFYLSAMESHIEKNEEALVKEISEYALSEREKQSLKISMLDARVKYLETMVECLITKVGDLEYLHHDKGQQETIDRILNT